MAWKLDGTYFENCSCEVTCPCTTSDFAVPADYERCQFLFVFHVDRGDIDGVDVSDRTVAVAGDAPGQMLDGNWRVGLILDDRASQEQTEKLSGVFSGQMGGPMSALSPLLGEILGVETMPIEYADEGRRHRVRIGDGNELEVEDFVSPLGEEGGPPQITGVHHPANSTLTVARAVRSRVGVFGLDLSFEGKSGFSAPFSWTG